MSSPQPPYGYETLTEAQRLRDNKVTKLHCEGSLEHFRAGCLAVVIDDGVPKCAECAAR